MKIALIEPPLRYDDKRLPLGLLYVSRYLKKRGYKHDVLTSSLLSDPELASPDFAAIGEKKIVEVIEKERFDIVGVTAFVTEQEYVIELSKIVKEISPFTLFVVGGPHATALPSVFFRKTIDVVVIGEGEETFLEIVQSRENDTRLSAISGIYYRERGHFLQSRPRKFIENLDSVGFPNYEHADERKLRNITYNIIRGVSASCAQVFSSRGCPFNCNFCSTRKAMGKKVRFRSIKSVKAEIEYLISNYKVESIYFVDDYMTTSYKRVWEICELMKQFGLPWGCQATANTLSRDMIDLFGSCGCVQIDFGIESGSRRILKEMKKPFNLDVVPAVFDICRKKNIRTYANFMIGFPSETKEEMMKTLDLALKIKSDMFGVWIFTPIPGTELWDKVDFEIDVDEYHKLNFTYSELSRKVNRSEVKDLWQMREYFFCQLAFLTMKRLLLNLPVTLSFIFSRPQKFTRTRCCLRFSYRMAKHIFRYPAKKILGKYDRNRVV